MIAALASGVLGQLEGLTSLSNGLSGVSSLSNNQDDATAATTTTAATSVQPAVRHGHGGHHQAGALSDQLQTLLLQQQSDSTDTAGPATSLLTAPAGTQADDTGTPFNFG